MMTSPGRSTRVVVAVAVSLAVARGALAQTRLPRIPTPNGHFIVEFRQGMAPAAMLQRFREDTGAMQVSRGAPAFTAPLIRREYSALFRGVAIQAAPATLASIAALPYVRTIHPDMPVKALSAGSATSVSRPTLATVVGTRGEGITVAVIDSGIDATHPALRGKIAGGYDFVNADDDPFDDNGHGTHVAGIIAAESPEMTGLAPGVTLLAYKVLDAYGVGLQSDVIAALERAADPDQDGDPADHADVANISLGGTGTPDDPQSLAVDAATAAGIIVCVAAGNDGSAFSILSPANARTAITVGASSEGGEVASFSSRGPSVKLTAIKPDILAPGESILSTVPGGLFATRSGTSMAAPYVAAACALVLGIHGDWSPSDIKSAITMTAAAAPGGVMSRGAGRIDVASASAAPIVASHSHFDLGLDADQRGASRRTRSILVTNVSGAEEWYDVSATSPDSSIVVRASPSRVELPPGAATIVTLTVTVDTDVVLADNDWIHEGVVTLSSRHASVHFAWAILTASRATLTLEQPYGAFYVLSQNAPHQPLWLSPGAAELYVTAGEHTIAAIGYDWNRQPTNATFIAAVRIIAGDVAIRFARSDAPHRIALRGENDRGVVLSDGGAGIYAGRFRIHAPQPAALWGFDLVTGDGRLSTSTLEAPFEIKTAEVGLDREGHEIVSLQYPTLVGVAQDVTLAARSAELKHQRVHLVFAHGAAARQLCVESIAIEGDSGDEPFDTAVVSVQESEGSTWNGDLYANEETADGHRMAVALRTSQAGHAADLATPAIRVLEGRFIASFDATPSTFLYSALDGETVNYGDGPAVVIPHVVASSDALHACAQVVGSAGESRPRALESSVLTLFDAQGKAIAGSVGHSLDARVEGNGAFRVELVTQCLCTRELPMRATLALDLDSRGTDSTPPAVTSIAVLGSAGRLASTIAAREAGSLVFTASDSDSAGRHRDVAGEATRAWYRRNGESEWTPLTTVQTGDDGESGRLGTQYRANLAPATSRGGGTVDLRVTVTDASGNASTLTLEPAFAVEPQTTRRRTVGHR